MICLSNHIATIVNVCQTVCQYLIVKLKNRGFSIQNYALMYPTGITDGNCDTQDGLQRSA